MDRQTYMEIDKENFRYNIEQIKKICPNKEVMPVLKGNAYGTYINTNLDMIKDFNYVAVALVSEGKYLREIGFKNNILILNPAYDEDIPNIVKYDLISSASSISNLKILSKQGGGRVHIELETGMGRTGVDLSNLGSFLDELSLLDNIVVEGVYTHFSSADDDFCYTNKQIEKFRYGVNLVKEKFNSVKYVHASASNGILNFKIPFTNMVRGGIIIYGYYPSTNRNILFKPVATLVSKIVYLKEIGKGVSIGYNRKFISDRNYKVATVGIGYQDGIRRSYAKDGYVLVNGIKCKILGNICMDSMMIDVTQVLDVAVGDRVYIWNNKEISLDDVAKCYDTINYEVISTIGSRVPRIFK